MRKYKKDFKRSEKRGKDMSKLEEVIHRLETGRKLPERCRVHRLIGEWQGCLEAKIEPDWLLDYQVTETELHLMALGTHSDLFRK